MIASVQDFHGDRLPRIPVMVQRGIDAGLKDWQEEQLTKPKKARLE